MAKGKKHEHTCKDCKQVYECRGRNCAGAPVSYCGPLTTEVAAREGIEMITKDDVDQLAEKLNQHADDVHGNDDIMNGLVRHLIRSIESNITQLWFYGDALSQRNARRKEID